jgi:hypothetical protein
MRARNSMLRLVVTGSGTFDTSSVTSMIDDSDARMAAAISLTVGKLAAPIAMTARENAERSGLHGD